MFDSVISNGRSRLLGILALALALTATACGDDDGGDSPGAGSGGSGDAGAAGGDAGSGGSEAGSGGEAGSAGSQAGSGGTGGLDDMDAGADVMVEIDFEARVGDALFACAATYPDLGTGNTAMVPLDFRLYIQDVMLTSGSDTQAVALEQDGACQVENVALLDFEDNTGTCLNGTTQTRSVIRGTVPAGDYDGIVMQVGVPEALNHDNPAQAPSPLNLTTLHWNWNAGYKFARIDFRQAPEAMNDAGMPDAGADAGMPQPPMPYNFHLGSTMCMGDATAGDTVSCGNPNRPEIRFDTFDPETQKIVIDYAALVADSNLAVQGGGSPGCMSFPNDPDCDVVFDNLGMSYATGEVEGTQSVFSVEAK